LLLPFFYTGPVPRTSAIFLVGMMGVGKSTVGVGLARKLGRVFIDTDQEVERKAGRTIPEIFAAEGEGHFRRIEAEVIRAAAIDGAVIALGGGAVAQPGAIEQLLEAGEVVYLKAAPAVLLTRVGDPKSRPLLAGLDSTGRLEKLTSLLEERLPLYRRARITVDASGTTDEVVEHILDELARA
jgi:shikimate kinase